MIENIKHYPVNWIEGMKINKDHFIDLQLFIEDSIRDARNQITNEQYYGLLTPFTSSPFIYSVSIDSHNELSIDIKSLKALTTSGGRVEISEYTNPFHEKLVLSNRENNDTNYFVMLNVNPFEGIPLGKQNLNEVPPRFPYTTPKYFISILAESEIVYNKIGGLQIPISKFKINDNKFELDTNYIPPCTTISSHTSLLLFFEKQDNFYKQIEFFCVQIIKKIKYRNSADEENVIANMTLQACDKILQFVEKIITQNKWKKYYLSPYETIISIVNLARTMKNLFDCFSGDGKETLFNYYSEWTDTKTGEYERILLDTINIEYVPYDIEPSIQQLNLFIDKVENLYSILNQLDYIGRKRDTGIFVNENVLKTDKIDSSIFKNDEIEEKKTTVNSPSFLAD